MANNDSLLSLHGLSYYDKLMKEYISSNSSKVAFHQSLSSGTLIGNIVIDGEVIPLYTPLISGGSETEDMAMRLLVGGI